MRKLACLCLVMVQGLACDSAPTPTTGTSGAVVAQVHQAKCGTCHTRVEPGARQRDELEPALLRHRKRVRLEEHEWQEMVDYLAAKNAGGKS